VQAQVQSGQVSRERLWVGWIITALVALFMVFDGATKVMRLPSVIQAAAKQGFSANMVVEVGSILLVCTALYAIPRTAVLGAILLTGYLGGAAEAILHGGLPQPLMLFPISIGVLAWVGIFCRDARLGALMPLRR
jgi:hypothetical protein